MSSLHSKPEGAKLGWEILATERLYEGRTFKLRSDRICLRGAEPLVYEYEERSAAVIIIPVTDAGEIVLIRQYRYPVDAWCLETPAGGCHDADGASLEEVVRKELREEIGASAGVVEEVGWFYSAPSFADEKCHVFVAWDVALEGEQKAESTEAIETRLVGAAEALASARDGRIVTAQCALALLRCEERLRARGFLRS